MHSIDALEIRPATSAEDLAMTLTLIREYIDGLGIDLSFQDVAGELAGFPGGYAPPAGRLLLATAGAQAAGCVGLRPLAPGICEMKRLYVRPAWRGQALGLRLSQAIVAEAQAMGYRAMRLDSLPTQAEAHGLYRRLGFREIPPYRHNPVAGTLFFELKL